ncbi:PQQ-binding-like beta-propeller repeat protein [Leptolyngbya sp. 7M]|uniref:outer membrane protein assembly factor BamB family protein n=1 Tax=Leptolyngbya sp. 7M TaxID=2812896 RepID=UPI001B8CAFB2|nr:PQQ-binding-like beta-propeller repeat protein [Leptolyngbya sp. 7M]QYO66735.1 PQQ-binding-like beta-propeller repeat protein [Leptolyngbya sp. 7M]
MLHSSINHGQVRLQKLLKYAVIVTVPEIKTLLINLTILGPHAAFILRWSLAAACIFAFFQTNTIAQENDSKAITTEKCWEYIPDDPDTVTSSLAGSLLLLKGQSGRLEAVNSHDGTKEWSVEIGGEIISRPVYYNERIYLVSAASSPNGTGKKSVHLRSISSMTGLPIAMTELPASDSYVLQTGDGRIMAIGSSGNLNAFDLDLKREWNILIGGAVTAGPIKFKDGATFASDDSVIRHVSLITGEILDRFPGDSLPTSIARDANGTIYLGDDRGRLYRIDPAAGKVIWTFKSGGRFESIISANGHILAASVDNFLYKVSASRGSVVWKRRLPGRILGDPLTGSDFLIVSVVGEGSAYIIESDKGKIVGKINFDDNLTPITAPVASDNGIMIFNLPGKVTAYRLGTCK